MKHVKNLTLREYFKKNPDVFALWGTKNTDEDLDKSIGSNDKAWWICNAYRHEYQKPIYLKINHPEKCSICNGGTVFKGINDLATICPNIASEWNFDKNDIEPQDVKYSSGKSVWWKCSCGHEWKTRIAHRTSANSGCPKCKTGGAKAKKYISDDDVMLSMFVSSLNDKTPDSISCTSDVRVSWGCFCGYRWKCSPKYFSGCPLCSGKVTEDGKKTHVTTKSIADVDNLLRLFDKDKNNMEPHHVSYSSAQVLHWVCSKYHHWTAPVYQVYRSTVRGLTGCPYCTHIVSSYEDEIYDFLVSIIPDECVVRNSRKITPPYEVDLYIPNHHIAIEFNGLFWHNEKHVPSKDYHYKKWKMCCDKGIQLITIWEDDWLNRRDIVQDMIQHKLGLSTKDKIYARNTVCKSIDTSTARGFLNSYHIQGFVPGSKYYALFHKENIVSVSVWKKNGNEMILSRYATSQHIVGGMGKMLKYGVKTARDNNCSKIVTFSDNCVSNGDVYFKLGFTPEKELRPDYMYIINGKRVHKFNYRKDRFKKDPELVYDPDMSESQLADLNCIPRIYDSGKMRWTLQL